MTKHDLNTHKLDTYHTTPRHAPKHGDAYPPACDQTSASGRADFHTSELARTQMSASTSTCAEEYVRERNTSERTHSHMQVPPTNTSERAHPHTSVRANPRPTKQTRSRAHKLAFTLAGLLGALCLCVCIFVAYKSYVYTQASPSERAEDVRHALPSILDWVKPPRLEPTAIDTTLYQSKSIYVLDITHDREIANMQADDVRAPASLTKIMTVYTALAHIHNLDEKVPIDGESYDALIKAGASMAGFSKDDTPTYRDLLYGTILPSGAEAALSLAVACSGSKEAFVDEMNQNAQKLGLTRTHFTNPTGLDEEGLYSSASDIATLLSHALKNPQFKEVFCTKEYTSSPTRRHPRGVHMESTVLSHIGAEDQEYAQILGGKSGTTTNAGFCWATLWLKDGCEYVVVVMGVPFTSIEDPGLGQKQDTVTAVQTLL